MNAIGRPTSDQLADNASGHKNERYERHCSKS